MNPNVVIGNTLGMNTNPNELTVQPGSTTWALNVEFNRDGVPERRKGFADDSENLPNNYPRQLMSASNGTDKYLHIDGMFWYYDYSSSKWKHKKASLGDSFGRAWSFVFVGSDIYLTSFSNHVVYKLDSTTGKKTVFAGKIGVTGSTDGAGSSARFNYPQGICTDGTNLFVTDSGNQNIRKIVISTASVTTFAGPTSPATGTTDATGTSARFNTPWAITYDGSNLYVADYSNHSIRKITSGAVVTTLCGLSGTFGDATGTGSTARFKNPTDVFYSQSDGLIYIADSENFKLKSSTTAGSVLTVYNATSNKVWSVSTDATNVYFVAGAAIYKSLKSPFSASILSGSLSTQGSEDGDSSTSRFYFPMDMEVSGEGLWVSDPYNSTGDLLTRLCKVNTATGYTTNIATDSDKSKSTTSLWADNIIHGPDKQTGSERRVRTFEMNGSAFFTTHKGVVKSSSLSATLNRAGMQRPLDIQVSTGSAASTMTVNQSRAYRTTWINRDSNNNLIVSEPSSRVVYTAGATENAKLRIYIPNDITTSDSFQVYATAIAGASIDPGDEMVLIYERQPTSTEIDAGYIDWDDVIPDALRNISTPLYTNASQEGFGAANAMPPLARDVCEFRNMAFYANYTEKQRINLQLIDAASLVAGTSTITIGGITYTSDTAEDVATGKFQKFTAGTVAQNIENTARSLCRIINTYVLNNSYWGYYSSTPDTIPGRILIEERGFVGDTIYVTCNNSTTSNTFYPTLPTSGSTFYSTAERRKNRIRVSKTQQPEHCPIANELVVGAESDEIQRIIALRDSVIVIKDRSIWRITGSVFDDLVATIVDDTVSVYGRDSAAKLNNTIFMLSNQGFVQISDNGVQIVGRPIETQVLAGIDYAIYDGDSEFSPTGIGLEKKRLYICTHMVPRKSAHNSQGFLRGAYCYNAITRQWSVWSIDAKAFCASNDSLCYGLANNKGHVLSQRNALSANTGVSEALEYCDTPATVTGSGTSGTNSLSVYSITYDVDYSGTDEGSWSNSDYSSCREIGFGWLLSNTITQPDGRVVVASVSGSSPPYSCTVSRNFSGSFSETFKIHAPIPVEIEWSPITAGNPGELKHFSEVIMRMSSQGLFKSKLSFKNEMDLKYYEEDNEWATHSSSDSIDVYSSYSRTPSSTVNDVDNNTVGNYGVQSYKMLAPFNLIRAAVTKAKAYGEHLSVRFTNATGGAKLAIKSLVVVVRPVQSNKVKQ